MKSFVVILLTFFCIMHNSVDCKEIFAVSAKFWNQTEYDDFISGNTVNVALHNNGHIKLAPKTENISGINASYVWCMANDQYGNVFVGTGNPGVVYKITGQKSAVEIFRSSGGLHIYSIASDLHGSIYVGTSPNGTIYKIDRERKVSLFCKLPDLYIWDMVVNSEGELFAATGDKGKIYKISANGEMGVILDSKATHILDLEIDVNDVIYACTEPFGLIYKIKSDGKVSVLYETKEDEVYCLTLGNNGVLYAGTASGGKAHVPTPQGQMSKLAAALLEKSQNSFLKEQEMPWTSFGLVDHPVQEENDKYPNEQEGKEKKDVPDLSMFFSTENIPTKSNAVYEIFPTGDAERILELETAFIFAIGYNGIDDIYVGTGNKAMIFQIGQHLLAQNRIGWHGCLSEQNIVTLFHVKSSQVLSLLAINNREIYVGTGNNGSVFKVTNDFSTSGFYESTVHDALVNSKWGRITWNKCVEKGTKTSLFTRTGNCKTPDSTWSNWEAPIEVQHVGSELFGNAKTSISECSGVIQSPQARFIQYRAEFSTIYNHATPTLNSVSVSYLPDNQPPNIVCVNVENIFESRPRILHEAENDDVETGSHKISLDKSKEEINPNKKVAKKLITWDVDDPDNDELQFSVFFKKANEINWCQIAKDIRGQCSYTWETEGINDGKYQIKVLASDFLSNPKENALQFAATSRQFSIDDTEPKITNIRVSTRDEGEDCVITGTVSDNISNISSMRYSVDTGDWVSIHPTDQIFDYRNEDFRFTLPIHSEMEHTVTINATDSENNIGSKKISVGIR